MLIKRKTQSSDTDDSSIVRTMKTLTLHFPDMCCPVEFGPVEHALAALSSDIRAVPDYSVRRVKINVPDRSPLEKNAILAAVSKTGQSFDVAASSGWSDDPSFDRVRITVPEMDCPVEAGEIERELKKAGIADYEIDIMNRRILTSGDTAHGVLAAVKAAGYEGTLEAEASASTAKGQTLLSVPEMDCPVEAGEIEREFNAAGIKGYEINVMNRTIAVPAAAAAAAQAAISAAGYESTVMKAREQETVFEDRTPWKRYILALIIALGCEFFEVAADNGYITLDEFLACRPGHFHGGTHNLQKRHPECHEGHAQHEHPDGRSRYGRCPYWCLAGSSHGACSF